jgi:hypothetical protein
MYNIPVNAVSKVKKNMMGIVINKGDRIKLLLNKSGSAALAINTAIKFGYDDYELFIREEEYDRLLNDK